MSLSFHCKGYRLCGQKKKGRNYKNQFLQGEMHMDNKET